MIWGRSPPKAPAPLRAIFLIEYFYPLPLVNGRPYGGLLLQCRPVLHSTLPSRAARWGSHC